MPQEDFVLEVKDLAVSYGRIPVLDHITFGLKKGEFLGIAGESGCGKTTLLRSLMMLRPPQGYVAGSVCFCGRELTSLDEESLRLLRGADIAMIPQNAAAAMDGTKTISSLFLETTRAHQASRVKRKTSDKLAADLMEKLLLQDTDRILRSYPFELSGGMCQRVMIAVSMIHQPKLILGDEPTSSLDVASQMEVVRELNLLKENYNVSLVMISHNLGVISWISDKIAIMYHGRIVEYGTHDDIILHARHPYTRALLAAVPDARGKMSGGLPGLPPSFDSEITGCAFAPRCADCRDRCKTKQPPDAALSETHRVQCFRARE